MQDLYAFTTHRPWSHAIAHWGKDVENRSNCCRIVPPGKLIAIHAGQKWDKAGAEWMKPYVGRGVIQGPENYPTGIVAIARFLGNIVPDKNCGELEIYKNSAWYQGQVGWVLADVVAIAPVSCSGQQGIWKLTDDNPKSPQLLSKVRDAYKEAIAPTPKAPALPPAKVSAIASRDNELWIQWRSQLHQLSDPASINNMEGLGRKYAQEGILEPFNAVNLAIDVELKIARSRLQETIDAEVLPSPDDTLKLKQQFFAAAHSLPPASWGRTEFLPRGDEGKEIIKVVLGIESIGALTAEQLEQYIAHMKQFEIAP